MESENHHLAGNTNILFKVYHQSIRGPRGKVQEFTTSLFPERPHILSLIEHVDKDDEIDMTSIENYDLGSKFCRQVLKYGCACILIH